MMTNLHTLLNLWCMVLLAPGLLLGSTPQDANRVTIEQMTRSGIVSLTSFNNRNQVISRGAGFMASERVIATSYEVVKNAAKVRAKLAGEASRVVRLFAVDQHQSIALLRLTGAGPDPLRMSSRKDLSPGDRVYVAAGGATQHPISATIGQAVSVRGTRFHSVSASDSKARAGSPIVDEEGNVIGLLGVENGDAAAFLVPVSSIDDLLMRSGTWRGVAGGVPGGQAGSWRDSSAASPDPEAPKVIRKSGAVLQGVATRRVEPVYPPLAHAAGVTGTVVVEVTIDEAGNVISAVPLSGHELLRDASVAAAMGWKFMPTKLEGKLVKVIGTITFNFQM
jgi:TonB family protein